jgi:hypothetical protein
MLKSLPKIIFSTATALFLSSCLGVGLKPNQPVVTPNPPGVIVVQAPVIAVFGSPLILTANGPTGTLTIMNTSTTETANNITSDFTGTALDGNVTETGNTCASVAPLASCVLTYAPGNTTVTQTDFSIQGSNSTAVTAAIQIDP